MDVQLHNEQKKAIGSDVNTVVHAGAGSGKTLVLAHRYLRLIREEKAGIENILTVTFTRKAAAEMYERIYHLLLRYADEPHVSRQLQRFDQARISTLDSFCASLVRDWSAWFGIPPTFSQEEEENLRIAEEVGLSFLLDTMDDDCIRQLVRKEGFDRVRNELFSSLALAYLPLGEHRDFNAFYKSQYNHLVNALIGNVEILEELLEQLCSLDVSAGKTVRTIQETAAILPDMHELAQRASEDPSQAVELKVSLASLRAIKNVGRATHPDLIRCKELFTQVKNLLPIIDQLAGSLAVQEKQKRLFELCAVFQERYHREKRRRGVLSFQDVQQMAVTLLRDHPRARAFYKTMYRYILIDEFQDNNRLQKQLLYLLSEREDIRKEDPRAEDLESGKLFFVGDEKQSIYRFRGADVSVFRELSDELSEGLGSSVALRINYRSSPDLVAFFNTFFSNVLQDARESYEARFESLESRAPVEGEKTGKTPPVRLFYKPYRVEGGADEDSYPAVSESAADSKPLSTPGQAYINNDEAEAYRIAVFIKESVESGSLQVTEKDGSVRSAGYDDIALLMRSTGNQVIFERMFRRFAIPYTTQSVRTLFLEAPINDLYTILQIAVHPEDRLAYAGFLRSPFVNLSDTSVLRLLLEDDSPPFQLAPEDAPLLPEDRGKYRAARRLYHDVRENVDVAPIHEIIRLLWYTYGYRYTILKDPASHSYLEYFDYLWQLAVDSDTRGDSLARFLSFLRSNLGKYERIADVDVVRETTEGVHIMTIHKSKGLEFPVVILANMGSTGNIAGDKGSLFHITDTFGLSFRTTEEDFTGGKRAGYNYFYSIGEEEHRKKEIAELKRLLYVGATRARDVLILSGSHNRNNRKDEKGPSCLLNVALEALNLPWRDQGNPAEADCIIPVELIPDVTEDEVARITTRYRKPAVETLVAGYREAEEISYEAAKREYRAIEFDPEWTVGGRDSAPYATVSEEPPGAGHPPQAAEPRAARVQDRFTLKTDRLGSEASRERGSVLPTENSVDAEFGTLCHHIVEQMLLTKRWEFTKQDVEQVKNRTSETMSLPHSVVQGLPAKHLKDYIEDALTLAEQFFRSSLGKRVQQTESVETEVPFLLREETEEGERFISGRIDLLFNDGRTTYLVDFKTDRLIEAEQYKPRMDIYKRAVEALRYPERSKAGSALAEPEMAGAANAPPRNGEKETEVERPQHPDENPIRCFLYYLRYGKTVEV